MASNIRLFFTVVLMFYASGLCEAQNPHTSVLITNNLGSNLDLVVHCKSKNDDLGAHLLHNGETYNFGFKPNIFGTTLFFCRFQWSPNDVHWFDIYDAGGGTSSECTTCVWSVIPAGPCRFMPSTNTYVCFPWNNNPLPELLV